MRTTFESPIGRLTLLGGDRGELAGVLFANEPYTGDEPDDPAALADARAAFERYFAGDAGAFADLALQFDGTPFQRAVWNALIELPFGQTTTYGELAAIAVGSGRQPRHVRACDRLGQRPHPDPDRDGLPPRDRVHRRADRIPRRLGDQAGAAGVRVLGGDVGVAGAGRRL